MRPFDIPDIRARELLTVIALSEYGSFVAAAAYLKTSQPALSIYEPGLWGPENAMGWMERQGRLWFDTCPVLA